jgi:hypothetical protein
MAIDATIRRLMPKMLKAIDFNGSNPLEVIARDYPKAEISLVMQSYGSNGFYVAKDAAYSQSAADRICKTYASKFMGDYMVTNMLACRIQQGETISLEHGKQHQITQNDLLVINLSLKRRKDGNVATVKDYI